MVKAALLELEMGLRLVIWTISAISVNLMVQMFVAKFQDGEIGCLTPIVAEVHTVALSANSIADDAQCD